MLCNGKPRSLNKLNARQVTLRVARSYVECLYLWHHTHFHKTFSFPKALLLNRMTKTLSRFTEREHPKVFKGMLADYFSKMNDQDRPEVLVSHTRLFPIRYANHVKKRLLSSNLTCVRISWDLMHSKALAADVPESFVKDTLLKHRATVSKVTLTPPEVRADFVKFIKPWLQEVGRIFPKEESSLPLEHSCYESPRSRGGVARHYRVADSTPIQPSAPRLDPTTIVISGDPGCGKSLLQSTIGKIACEKLGGDWDDVVYSRNARTAHWDGYNGQPIVFIDDWMQSTVSKTQDCIELDEFIQLNSTVDYRLPMADLSEKGMKFTSPIIIYSTNRTVESLRVCANFKLYSEEAFFRRIDHWVEYPSDNFHELKFRYGAKYACAKATRKSSPVTFCVPDPARENKFIVDKHVKQVGVMEYKYTTDRSGKIVPVIASPVADELWKVLYKSWNQKSHFYSEIFGERHTIPVMGGEHLFTVPEEVGHNRCKVSPIIEPLKVRTITIGTANNFVLKTLQQSMQKALKAFPCFKPCWTPDYQEDVQKLYLSHQDSNKKWLSGDYTAATDGLHQDLFLSGIYALEDHIPSWLFQFVLREASAHLIEYPSKYNIPDVVQTNGQLMGSLLSFPFLCMANAYTVHKATGKPLGSLPAFIHGDDLLARFTLEEKDSWYEFTKTIGLELSVGKNYYSEHWGSIDSQVFHGRNSTLLGTGKYRCYRAETEAHVSMLLKKQIPKAMVVALCKRTGALTKTPRSIDVSTKYGGLGVEGLPVSDRDWTIYAQKIQRDSAKVQRFGELYQYSLPSSVISGENRPLVQQHVIGDETVASRDAFKFCHRAMQAGITYRPDTEFCPKPLHLIVTKGRDAVCENLVRQVQDLNMRAVSSEKIHKD